MRKKQQVPEIDPREKVEESIENLETFVRKAETKRRTLLDKAKIAKARGDKQSFNMATNALRMIMMQQKQAEQMSLMMGIVLDTRDVQSMMGAFFSNMQSLCAQMGQVPDMKQMNKAAAEFARNMDNINRQTMTMDDMMTRLSESMNAVEFDGISSNDEIGRMIERELANELSVEDIEIARQLEDAKKTV